MPLPVLLAAYCKNSSTPDQEAERPAICGRLLGVSPYHFHTASPLESIGMPPASRHWETKF